MSTNHHSQAAMANMRRLRQRSGLSQDALAAALSAAGIDTSRSKIAAMESGRYDAMTVDQLVALADIFDVQTIDLISFIPCGTCEGNPASWFHLQRLRSKRRTYGG